MFRFEILMVALVVVGLSASRPSSAVMPTREGTVPAEVKRAFDQGLFAVPSEASHRTSLVYPTWKVPVILADFTDQPMTFTNVSDWNKALFDTTGSTPTGSVFDYFTWVSGNRLRVVGQVVATIHLSRPKDHYADLSWGLGSDPSRNIYAAVDEALRMCPPGIDWSEFDRDLNGKVDVVWVVHSGIGGEHTQSRRDLWSSTSKLSDWPNGHAFETNDLVPGTQVKEVIDLFAILPEMSVFQFGQRSEIGVYCHEFGHALGLPDLYERGLAGSSRNVGIGNWSLMSTGAYGTDGQSPQYPSHLGAWPLVYMEWASTIRPTENGPMALGPLANGGKILDLWFQGEQGVEHFLVENRQRVGFDRNLPDTGLIVYHLNDEQILAGVPSNRVINGLVPSLRVVEADGRHDLTLGDNRGEGTDLFPGSNRVTRWDDTTNPNSRSNTGNVTHVGLTNIAVVGDSVRFQVQVRAPGWQLPRNASLPGFLPMVGSSRGSRAGLLADGSVVTVTSEIIAGRAQVALRTRGPDHAWGPLFQVSASTGAASEPSIGVLPGGDLCVVWSDSRHGANELYFRARVLGVWSAERRLTNLPGHSRSPALGADDRGGVHLGWHYTDGGTSSVAFMYFPYLVPGGTLRLISPTGARPDPPAVAVGLGGSSYIVWSDRGVNTPSIWYSHFAPDSGARPAMRMVETQGILPGVAATVDPYGSLHTLWQIGATNGNTVRYQIRNSATLPDTALLRRGDSIQDFGIASAPDGSLHVVVEAAVAGSSQILYKQWRASGGWDVGATEITRASEPPASRAMVVPYGPDQISILYLSFGPSGTALVEKDRGEWPALLPTSVPPEDPLPTISLRAGPNPLRVGSALRLSFSGEPPPGGQVEVFDVSGRRVASANVRGSADRWTAEIPSSVTAVWRDGVYFVRAGTGSRRGRASFVVIR